MINFGTDGWRAVLDEEFNDENVEKVVLAIGKYVYDNYGYDKQILIGYDPRKKADYYADKAAEILSKKGFMVTVSSGIVPTPVLAFNAKFRNACAIMLTASHNPPEYLGIKFIPDYAGPATSEITDAITNNLDKDFPVSGEVKEVITADLGQAYFARLGKLIDFSKIKKLNSQIIYDGMYSASIGYLDKILNDNGIKFTSIHIEHDSDFGGLMPDPKPKYLTELINKINDCHNAIGIATDGDADRFGIVDEMGYYVPPDVIISILLKYLVKKGYKGSVVKTVGSGMVIDEVAKRLGIDVIETAVGFKHVGEAMRNNEVIIGGEESGGLSIQGHIPEKDGILANLLLLEAVADSGTTLEELHQKTYESIGCRFFTDRIDLSKNDDNEVSGIIEMFKNLNSIGEYEVTDKNLIDGVKLMLGNKAKILVRKSGTEPLLRIYFEADNKDKLNYLKSEVSKMLN